MVRPLIASVIACFCVGITPASAQKASSTRGTKPEATKAARAQKGVTRSGVAVVDVDFESGKVVRVRMLKSTGNDILDNAAINGFLKYRFKPKTVRRPVKIPITFTVTGADI